jgi:hypothetical protein
MRWSWNLSIEPTRDHKVYLVVDGFGHNGRILRETDVETTVTDLMSEQYVAPVRVVAVNPAEHRVEDASEVIAGRFCAVLISPGTSYHHRSRHLSTITSARTGSSHSRNNLGGYEFRNRVDVIAPTGAKSGGPSFPLKKIRPRISPRPDSVGTGYIRPLPSQFILSRASLLSTNAHGTLERSSIAGSSAQLVLRRREETRGIAPAKFAGTMQPRQADVKSSRLT